MELTKLPCGCMVRPMDHVPGMGRFEHQCLTHSTAGEAQHLLLRIHSEALTHPSVTLDKTPGGILDQIRTLCRRLIKG